MLKPMMMNQSRIRMKYFIESSKRHLITIHHSSSPPTPGSRSPPTRPCMNRSSTHRRLSISFTKSDTLQTVLLTAKQRSHAYTTGKLQPRTNELWDECIKISHLHVNFALFCIYLPPPKRTTTPIVKHNEQ